MKLLRTWKKVFEVDLENIIIELKEAIDKPSIIILNGPVGAGKTTFTKKFIGIEGVNSPTYSIVNEIGKMGHADFYRIEEAHDIEHLELPLYLEGKDYFFIEWGSKFVHEISRYLDDSHNLYEVDIEINESKEDDSVPTRNFTLKAYEI